MKRVLLFVLVLLGLLVAFALLPVEEWLTALVGWIRGLGLAGAVLFAVLYAVATVAMAPGSPLTLAAGFAWGPVGGFLVVWPGATLGAVGAFLLGRTVVRGQVERWTSDSPRFRAIDRAIAQKGLANVTLLRLSPIVPFNLLNYALGITGVRTGAYVAGTALGMIPGIFLYAYLGSTVTSFARLLDGTEGGPAQDVLYWGGLAATLAVTVLVTRTARRALEEQIDE